MLDPKFQKKLMKLAKEIAKAKNQPRFIQVLGKLKKEQLLDVPNILEYGGPVDLEDVLWAGQYEPRILEVLPGVLHSHPKLFRIYKMPADLQQILKELERGNPSTPFRSIPPNVYQRWVNPKKSILKTFRFSYEDIKLIKSLKLSLNLKSDIDVIRKGLESLKSLTSNM